MSRFDWTPQAAVEDQFSFSRIVPNTVLFEYDGPRIFTVEAREGLFLFYLSAESGPTYRYIAAPTSLQTVDELTSGALSVRGALEQKIVWVADASWDGVIEQVWRTVPERIPDHYLPKGGTMLHPELQPALTLRYSGPEFEPGRLRASTLENAIRRAIDSIRALGEPNPVVQRFQMGSLEIDFSASSPVDADDAFIEHSDGIGSAARRLEEGLSAVEKGPEWIDLLPTKQLEALNMLTLVQDGAQTLVEIGGRHFPNGRRYFIDWQQSQTIRATIERRREQREGIALLRTAYYPLTIRGQIRRFDKDNLFVFVRPIGKKNSKRCKISRDLVDIAIEVFAHDRASDFVGVWDGKALSVETISPVPTLPNL